MIGLPGGWVSTQSRDLADGSSLVLAERVHPVDLGPRERNLSISTRRSASSAIGSPPGQSGGIAYPRRLTSDGGPR